MSDEEQQGRMENRTYRGQRFSSTNSRPTSISQQERATSFSSRSAETDRMRSSTPSDAPELNLRNQAENR